MIEIEIEMKEEKRDKEMTTKGNLRSFYRMAAFEIIAEFDNTSFKLALSLDLHEQTGEGALDISKLEVRFKHLTPE
jgi:hypothetical protein